MSGSEPGEKKLKLTSSDYRHSHATEGYGAFYQKTYERGYYAAQWREIERPLLKSVLEKLRASGKKRYLDFACGTGRIMSLATTVFEDVSGVDISDDMAQHARANSPEATIHAPRDITRDPLDSRYEVISAFRFFLNAQPELRKNVLAAMGAMQQPGDALVCNVHVNSKSPMGLAYRVRNRLLGREVAATLGLEKFRSLLDEMHYDIEEVYYYSYWPRLGSKAPALQERLLTIFEKVKLMPRGMAQSFLLVCRKR